MRICILGDTHFGGGYSLGKIVDPNRQINSRLVDYSNTFDYFADFVISNNISHVIITGDIFEQRKPHASELSLFGEKMRRFSENNVNVHIPIGNHDLIYAHKATTVDILKSLNIPHIYVYNEIDSIACSDKKGDIINVIFLPFRNRKMLKCSNNVAAIQRIADRIHYEINDITKGPKILVGHLMVEGTKLADGIDSVELVLPHKIFDGLDAVIMGHVHPHKILRVKPLIAYIGSMEKKKFDEGQESKYFMVIENKNDEISYHFEQLPVRKLFDIVVNQADKDTNIEALKGIQEDLIEIAKNKDLFGSILRLQLFLSEQAQYGFNKQELDRFLRKELKVHNCVGIHIQISSARQLRKASITERADPISAFREYIDLEEKNKITNRMRELGLKIIGG